MGIWRDLPGPTLYSAGQQSSQWTAQFRPSGVLELAGGDPSQYWRVLQGPRDWVWVGPLRHIWLWSFRVRCWFWTFRLAAVSRVHNIGSRLVLNLVALRVVVSFHLFSVRPSRSSKWRKSAPHLRSGFSPYQTNAKNPLIKYDGTMAPKKTSAPKIARGSMKNGGGQNSPPLPPLWTVRKKIAPASKSTLNSRKLVRFLARGAVVDVVVATNCGEMFKRGNFFLKWITRCADAIKTGIWRKMGNSQNPSFLRR